MQCSIWRYYIFDGIYLEISDDIGFEEFDVLLDASGQNLEQRYRGENRFFRVELDNFDEESRQAEVLLAFTWHAIEEDDSVIEEILNGCKDELEQSAAFHTEEITFLGLR